MPAEIVKTWAETLFVHRCRQLISDYPGTLSVQKQTSGASCESIRARLLVLKQHKQTITFMVAISFSELYLL